MQERREPQRGPGKIFSRGPSVEKLFKFCFLKRCILEYFDFKQRWSSQRHSVREKLFHRPLPFDGLNLSVNPIAKIKLCTVTSAVCCDIHSNDVIGGQQLLAYLVNVVMPSSSVAARSYVAIVKYRKIWTCDLDL